MKISCQHGFRSNRHKGFSLLEVIVTVAILTIGLLGLAAMQATSLNNNHSAYQRSQAAVLAYDIADRMRANMSGISSYKTSVMSPANATVKSGCMSAGACTAVQMAENDLYYWNKALTDAGLPSVAGTITVNGNVYTVSVRWDINRDGSVTTDDNGFSVSFRP